MRNEINLMIENIEDGFLLTTQHENDTYAGYGERKFFIKDKKALKAKVSQELDKVLAEC